MLDTQVKEVLDALNGAFLEFRASNDARLEKLEKQNGAIRTLQKQVRDVETAAARGSSYGGPPSGDDNPGRPEAREAFRLFLRSNNPSAAEAMSAFAPQAAMSTSVGGDGGFAVPPEIAADIIKLERSLSVMRQIARIRPVSSDRPEQLVNKGGIGSGWVGELDSRGDTASDALGGVFLPMGEIFAQPTVTQREVDDAMFDIGQFITESVAEEFSVKEGAAFVSGDAINKPRGFLSVPNAELPDATRPFGTLEFKKSGASGAFVAAPNGGNCLVDLVHTLRAPYRQGAVWTMNSKTLSQVRQLKDTNGSMIWRAGLEAGKPGLLLGYPAYEDENMPDIAANSYSIAFGNFQRGYTIADHVVGVRMLRDALTVKGRVKFYTTRRVGGGVTNSQAIKLLKFSA